MKYTPQEQEALNCFYAEVENAQEQIQHHVSALDDRDCNCIKYHQGLLDQWREEEKLITERISNIEKAARKRMESQNIMVL